jgi:hypothetical protein
MQQPIVRVINSSTSLSSGLGTFSTALLCLSILVLFSQLGLSRFRVFVFSWRLSAGFAFRARVAGSRFRIFVAYRDGFVLFRARVFIGFVAGVFVCSWPTVTGFVFSVFVASRCLGFVLSGFRGLPDWFPACFRGWFRAFVFSA